MRSSGGCRPAHGASSSLPDSLGRPVYAVGTWWAAHVGITDGGPFRLRASCAAERSERGGMIAVSPAAYALTPRSLVQCVACCGSTGRAEGPRLTRGYTER